MSRAMFNRVPGTSLGRIFGWTDMESGWESSHRFLMWMIAWTMLSQSLWMNERGPASFEIVRVNWLSSTRQTSSISDA